MYIFFGGVLVRVRVSGAWIIFVSTSTYRNHKTYIFRLGIHISMRVEEWGISGPPNMASKTTTFDRYKLDTDFDGDTIFHKSFTSDLQARQRRVTVNTTWKKEKMLGAGAFGVVWRQRQIGVGKLRAVKIIPKQHLVVREVEALIELRDVSP
jgi:hypothetical protein